MSNDYNDKLKRLYTRLNRVGVNPTHKKPSEDIADIEAKAKELAKVDYDTYKDSKTTQATHIADYLKQALDIVSTAVVSVLLILGSVFAVLALIYTEYLVAYKWFSAFNTSFTAVVYSVALISTLLITITFKTVITTQEKVSNRNVRRFSLLNLLDSILYWLGVIPVINYVRKTAFNDSVDIYRYEDSERLSLVMLAYRLVIGAMVLFGVLGRLYPVLNTDEYNSIAWYQVLNQLLQDDIFVVMGVVTGVVYTLVITIGFDILISILYDIFTENTGGIKHTENFLEDLSLDYYQQKHMIELLEQYVIMKEAIHKES